MRTIFDLIMGPLGALAGLVIAGVGLWFGSAKVERSKADARQTKADLKSREERDDFDRRSEQASDEELKRYAERWVKK